MQNVFNFGFQRTTFKNTLQGFDELSIEKIFLL